MLTCLLYFVYAIGCIYSLRPGHLLCIGCRSVLYEGEVKSKLSASIFFFHSCVFVVFSDQPEKALWGGDRPVTSAERDCAADDLRSAPLQCSQKHGGHCSKLSTQLCAISSPVWRRYSLCIVWSVKVTFKTALFLIYRLFIMLAFQAVPMPWFTAKLAKVCLPPI